MVNDLTIEELKNAFSPDLLELIFLEIGNKIIVRIRRFVASDMFHGISTIIMKYKGVYISEGENSRFEVPKIRKYTLLVCPNCEAKLQVSFERRN